ncbi:MAG: DUF2076 domain-containing protein [Buchnera aphidicola (Pentalonia nigronervosa)]|jgi:hypothetical protein|uniref:DUF2076 domain-containing protein n=1 Tax=Buchnera aphidicola (Pentalonia nigronervosa) TaxID=1309793 RepID=A0A7H1AZK1_9GAMM|nr:MAG: DUF2076 domain-containing protein [Buchnera aphidicola (Pentalonia nigronervosa)]
MKNEEKILIENLFHRLKKIDSNNCAKDSEANDLIQEFVKRQPSSSYYMTQTILIQETAIKKMSMEIENLKQKVSILQKEQSEKKPSFLSNFFKNKTSPSASPHDRNVWNDKNHLSAPYHSHATPSFPTPNPGYATTGNGSFLSNALQTATGVAGGMILGNMLMNVFNHTKPEEEIFNAIHTSNENHHIDHPLPDNSIDVNSHTENNTNLTSFENNESADMNKNIHYSNDANNINNIENTYDVNHETDDIDMHDDNFI